jgi:hypothetical protein
MPFLLEILPRLSERNCIEIVAKLVAEKKLDVVHTLDGKEYITPSQISREIRDELYIHGGQLAPSPPSDSNASVFKPVLHSFVSGHGCIDVQGLSYTCID